MQGNACGAKGPYSCYVEFLAGDNRLTEENRSSTEKGYILLPPAFARNEKGLPEAVFRLRKRLYIKAKQEPRFRFYALYDRITRPDVLAAAWALVASNDGKPGVDGVAIKDIEESAPGVDGFLRDIQHSLNTKQYKPQAVRRVMIPKANGGERPLGIPTVRDRTIQTATKLVIEPIFEADFLDSSYGFRPKRSAIDALDAIQEGIKQGRSAIYDADLKGYFDTIPHDKLMACVEKRIADRSVLKLIRQWLNAPILEKAKDRHHPPKKVYPKRGTPQGGVISPLLANLYLHWLEKRFHGKDGPARFAGAQIVRYADDFVILARYQGQRLSDWVEDMVEGWMGLTINRDKTRIVKLTEAGSCLDFLGYSIRYEPDKYGRKKRFLNRVPSAKACAREREKLRTMVNKTQSHTPIPELIERVNTQLSGWAGYFNKGGSRPAFRHMNSFVVQRMTKHLKRRSQRPYRPPQGVSWYAHLYNNLGLVRL